MALLLQVALCSQTKTCYFVLDTEQSTAAEMRKGLGTENCLPTEYNGHVSAAADAGAAV